MNVAQLSTDAVIRTARERTGLDALGRDDFLPALTAYIDALKEKAAGFSGRGNMMVAEELIGAVASRLRIEDYVRRNPAVEQEEISRPVFITGLYRTATSKLHSLLCADPRWLYLQTWQSSAPVPLQDAKPGEPDPRIEASRKSLGFLTDLAPHAALAHPLGATDPSEEYPLLTQSFRAMDAKQLNPKFMSWLARNDHTAMYRDLKRALQVLQFQFKRPGVSEQRYCLKAPSHLGNVEFLMNVFPDAKVIFTHRDPFPAVHSFTMVRESLRGIYVDEPDPKAVGDETLEQAASALDASLAAKAKFAPGTFLDLAFNDIVRRPLDIAARIYAYVDSPLTADAAAALKREDTKSSEHKSRAQSRDPARYGLSPERVHQRTADYLDWARKNVGELVEARKA